MRETRTSRRSTLPFAILVWQAQVEKALIPLHVLPFLPVNPAFSATRNQVRRSRWQLSLSDLLPRPGPTKTRSLWSQGIHYFHPRYSQRSSPTVPRLHLSIARLRPLQMFVLALTGLLFLRLSPVVHTLPRQTNQGNTTLNNASLSTQDMMQANGQSSTAALINAFIDSDDEPLYDKVASDEDYSNLPNHEQHKRSKLAKKTKPKVSASSSISGYENGWF